MTLTALERPVPGDPFRPGLLAGRDESRLDAVRMAEEDLVRRGSPERRVGHDRDMLLDVAGEECCVARPRTPGVAFSMARVA